MKNETNITPSGIIDSHCHLDLPDFDYDFNDVLQRARDAGISHIITIGTTLSSSGAAIALAKKHPQLWATIGVHPHDVATLSENDYAQLKALYYKNREVVVGFGEIGLDFFKNYADPGVQRYHFEKQLETAAELHLPIIIHSRDAEIDTLKLLQKPNICTNGGILHCFSSDYEYAKKILDLGLLISIPGIVTYKNAHRLIEVVKKIPLNKIIVETDAPYLAPSPHRGQRNEPSFIQYTVRKIAEIKCIPVSEVADTTSNNVRSLFKIRPEI